MEKTSQRLMAAEVGSYRLGVLFENGIEDEPLNGGQDGIAAAGPHHPKGQAGHSPICI